MTLQSRLARLEQATGQGRVVTFAEFMRACWLREQGLISAEDLESLPLSPEQAAFVREAAERERADRGLQERGLYSKQEEPSST